MARSYTYAGAGSRLLAYIIDAIIVGVASSALSSNVQVNNVNFMMFGPSALLGAAYHILLWVYWDGQTLGKKALGIRVVKEDGSKMDLATAAIRYVGYYISAAVLLLGYIWILFDSKKQGWHDKIAHTFVVKA